MLTEQLSSISPLYRPQLEWIASQKDEMIHLVTSWADINSGSLHIDGLNKMLAVLKQQFASLNAPMEEHKLKPMEITNAFGKVEAVTMGKALSLVKRPTAPVRIFLGGHFDTVYGADGPFQKTTQPDSHTLKGPGVADMKGGLVILLKALQAFEQFSHASRIGWEILLNPDEEIGSIGSRPLLEAAAARNHYGLIFEPAFHDGALVSSRKGTANYSITARGKPAHAGRDFHLGSSAIYAIADVVQKLEKLTDLSQGTTVNVGRIEGGGPLNIVPDLALCHVNIRALQQDEFARISTAITEILAEVGKREGITLEWRTESHRPPKLFDDATQELFNQFKNCGTQLGIPLQWRPSGGGSDGNILSAQGLPTIDTLGAVGGNIHTPEEYLKIESLTERACLTALFLMKLANDDLSLT